MGEGLHGDPRAAVAERLRRLVAPGAALVDEVGGLHKRPHLGPGVGRAPPRREHGPLGGRLMPRRRYPRPRRLPLCTAADLAALCDLPLVTLQEELRRLVAASWVVRLNLTDPGFEPLEPREPVWVISEAARRVMLADTGRAEADFGPLALWQLRPRSVPDAISAAPLARAGIACLAQLARTIARQEDGRLAWATASPPTRAANLRRDPDAALPGVLRLSTSSDFVSAREQRLCQCRRFRRRMPQRRFGVQVHRWPGCSC